MSSENEKRFTETDAGGLNFEATLLTLGLPGEPRVTSDGGAKLGNKRGFLETVDLKLGDNKDGNLGQSRIDVREAAKSSVSRTAIVGWPPVRGVAKRGKKSCKFVKVAVDGAPYLRKVDLHMYRTYQQLLTFLEYLNLRTINLRKNLNDGKTDEAYGIEYVPTYEDKDGDWMLVGDVPWEMFVESCKRLRLMKKLRGSWISSKDTISKLLKHKLNKEAF